MILEGEAMMKVNKIEIFGDSVMQGVVYNSELKRYKLCRNKYDELRESGIEVKNNARMGATIDRGLETIERLADRCDENTLVLLEFGGNDCDYDWEKISSAPDDDHAPHTTPERFNAEYKTAVAKLKERGANVALATLVPVDASKYINWITQNRSYDNILKWLGDVSMLSRWQEYYNRIVEDIAKELACPLIDIRGKFLRTHKYSECLCADGIHPSELGHGMIEREITDAVLKLA